jgi:hypothetical protein
MNGYTVVPMRAETAASIRERRRDPVWNHPAAELPSDPDGTCRVCLEPFTADDAVMLLATHDSFEGVRQHRQPGPVLLHARECTPREPLCYPEFLKGSPRTFESFDRAGELVRTTRHSGGDEDALLTAMLEHPDIAYIHVRNTGAGCFMFRVLPAAR